MPKILVIDDDEDFIIATQLALEPHDFVVEGAMTSQEGIAKVLSDKPDLVVLDVVMETDDEGFVVAREIREKLNLRDLPIIMLSNIHRIKQVPYRFAPDDEYLPVDVFLDKPVQPELLLEMANALLGESRETPKHPL